MMLLKMTSEVSLLPPRECVCVYVHLHTHLKTESTTFKIHIILKNYSFSEHCFTKYDTPEGRKNKSISILVNFCLKIMFYSIL